MERRRKEKENFCVIERRRKRKKVFMSNRHRKCEKVAC
jgi:hypothetical protein